MKWKLSLLTLCVLLVAGLLAPETARERPAQTAPVTVSVLPDLLSAERPAAMATALGGRIAEAARPARYQSEISDKEAVRIALERGQAIAAERIDDDTPVLRRDEAEVVSRAVSLPDAAVPEPDPAPEPLWRVTADRVNLRGGPGTEHPVVGGVVAGDVLIPVSGLDTDWIEVRDPAGRTAWIFARFLAAEG